MDIQTLVLTFFVDALLNFEEQKPDSFTVNGWLILQLLLIRSPQEAERDGLALKPPWSTTLAYEQLGVEAERILDAAQIDWDAATTSEQQAAVLDTYSDQLLEAVAASLPRLLVPSDWQLHWMGVEG